MVAQQIIRWLTWPEYDDICESNMVGQTSRNRSSYVDGDVVVNIFVTWFDLVMIVKIVVGPELIVDCHRCQTIWNHGVIVSSSFATHVISSRIVIWHRLALFTCYGKLVVFDSAEWFKSEKIDLPVAEVNMYVNSYRDAIFKLTFGHCNNDPLDWDKNSILDST